LYCITGFSGEQKAYGITAILFALIFVIGCRAVESIRLTGATILMPLMEKPDASSLSFITIFSPLKQPMALIKKQANKKSRRLYNIGKL
jgi:hypothetical protein